LVRLTELHRVPASPGFHEAIEYVRDRATAIGLSDVVSIQKNGNAVRSAPTARRAPTTTGLVRRLTTGRAA